MSDANRATRRRILVVAHTGRADAVEAGFRTVEVLLDHGVTPVLEPAVADALTSIEPGRLRNGCDRLHGRADHSEVELCIVLGGDGTILRAAEILRETGIPILGVNLGHVGFLAESERDSLPYAVKRVLDRDYVVEQRMTLDLTITNAAGDVIAREWALNDASIEKVNRAKMLEVVVEVDGQPLSSFGCDGVIFSTPTGSTAYSFSAGGPVVWPEVEAMLMVPISAHALFSKPVIVSTASTLAVEIVPRTGAAGVMWCDGRRQVDLPPGARIEATTSSQPVTLARLHDAPFSRRLVEKFRLPTSGWRGPVPQ
ncbi:NAD kinase 2 [Pseudoclavibacter endophyticus]|uniref:NAD kinase n=1 Tax=Pseudoclavibacter endophyticus TaxID=1778590 RepID=A0A6H9WNI5_9MICO|nr:NAD kinase [Pseudoclavibacter endophyticus]KAB1650416.1 NAD kinase [Pseudoclavibacter endophyticus]GGA54301.1 NAD kinase 2 [Pseudoclavibacter endophyticus]